ncbi:MAG: ribonucleoside-diphosphate reductase subunit alpha [Candidatus Taylorbacteria bacterium RIFCSPLOWO2_01_FULL_44_26]|uniref:Ribonucleoside-diphosphate reductase n=2 Tax=Candidatus Tayloriibacteriota TaxID=1817919 RepID=A0A1G2MK95_9BACT|nr:MAG: ribonucleoside-diphosphate reductase subunit alpha [Candidatus Taylorbacteria bacterium RIFCSPHIGHO2_02_FULL_44_12]OHA30785.1 MAG: ribonucleoside-diphosphate reductase subunit alpha [Candidatus Taylorbacteria bacterium RIFCSPLOWO2_01_FULL_44_26]
MSISIKKADGTRESFNADRINRSIERACVGLTDPISMVTQIATETQLTLYDDISTDELDQATINTAVQNIKEDTDYDKVATRLLLKTIYRKVIGDYDKESTDDLKQKHRDSFIAYILKGIGENRLHSDMAGKFDLQKLADVLDVERDELFVYAGLDGLINRYFLKDQKNQPLETPQYFFMRVAMGLSYNEKDPTNMAKKFYSKMSRHEYIAGGSTNLGAGTIRSSLSNCFLLEVHDDMAHIAKTVSDVMRLSKDSGGIGLSITKLRAAGSPLKSNFGGQSSGPTPFAKVFDTAIRAISRAGKKMGALCFYMENWHMDFPEFLDWKHNSGDDYMRMRTANTAAYLSDEFMKRVEAGQDWYMFDPVDVTDLNELYGQDFSKRYAQYVEMAEKGELRTFKKVPAQEQYRQILVSLQSTSHPWLVWKDTINNRALNNNTGTIHMSNLCTEICLPQDKENIAVCNLASLNLAAHINNKEVNWGRLEESVRLAIRQLDNLIDINVLSISEASKSDHENRAIGLGVMGFADTIERLGMAYDSEHAWNFADRIFEFVSYMAIDESANLAAERGSYKNFSGSEWSKGLVPIDTLRRVSASRDVPVTVDETSKHRGLNWDILRAKVKKGMRNATLLAVAPNANIGLVVGTTPGIDARFAQVFSRNKISGKYLDLNHNLVKDLKNMGLWEKVRESIIENQGDISGIPSIPQYLKDIYKTAFTTSPHAYIEVAARAQKWIDQALSRNMYLDTRDIDETMNIYMSAWKKGLKSTYYLHMKPRHSAEQSTTRVNKAEKMGKKGFATVASARKEEEIAVRVQEAIPTPLTDMEISSISESNMVSVSVRQQTELSQGHSIAQAMPKESSLETKETIQQEPFLEPLKEKISVSDVAKVCPIDPAERAQCDSCQ